MEGEDGDAIREALEKLKTSSMEIGKSIYSQANQSENQTDNQDQSQENQENKENKEEKKDETK
jgi:hypothetical protein